MRHFLDTNVLIAACLGDHEHHARALPIVQQIHEGKVEGFVSAHALLEMHAILTRLPRVPRIDPLQAFSLIEENVINHFSVVTLTGKEYSDLARKLGRNNVAGGKAYDVLHLTCAEKCGADRIYTFNLREFMHLGGHVANKIAAP